MEFGLEVTGRDFFRDPLSEPELRELCRLASADKIFSWASPRASGYRGRRGEIPDSELIKLMLGEPRLIRRPMLVRGKQIVIGFKPAEYQRLAGGS